MKWHLAPSLVVLRYELNARWPNRDRSSDGAIGDAAHAASASDHNPNSEGAVCAYDIDTDLDGTDDSNDPEMDALVEFIRTHPHPTLKYVIYRGRIFRSYPKPGIAPFEWSAYTKDPHISHPHVSVGQGPDGRSAPGTYNDTSSWLSGFEEEDELTPEQMDELKSYIDLHFQEVLQHLGVSKKRDDGSYEDTGIAGAVHEARVEIKALTGKGD